MAPPPAKVARDERARLRYERNQARIGRPVDVLGRRHPTRVERRKNSIVHLDQREELPEPARIVMSRRNQIALGPDFGTQERDESRHRRRSAAVHAEDDD